MSKQQRASRDNRTFMSSVQEVISNLKSIGIIKWLAGQRDVYPVIVFALLPGLFLWTRYNLQEITLKLMWRTFFYAVLIALAYYLIWYVVFRRDKFKASIMATITVITTYTFDEIFHLYQKVINKTLEILFRVHVNVTSYLFFLALLVVFYAMVIYFLKKRLKYSRTIQNYLTILATVLLIFNLFPLALHLTTNNSLLDTPYGSEVKAVKKVDKKPDIFFLMPEDYASDRTLKNIYKYDNSGFTGFLQQKGFYTASQSVANYPFTTPSLASEMNLSYLPDAFRNKPDNGTYYEWEKYKIENNRAAEFLQKQGYEFINLGSWWTATKYNKNADQDLYNRIGLLLFNKTIDLKEHELALFQNTMAWPLFNKRVKIGNSNLFSLTFPPGKSSDRTIQQQSFFRQIDTLKNISHQKGPKYVFAHFMVPHGPYVFDGKCNYVGKGHFRTEDIAYINQVKCVNTKLKETIDYILANNDTDPIIILQTDEGSYPEAFREDRDDFNWDKAPIETLYHKAGIQNAIYFPDKEYSKLYPSISPVNMFRVVFNKYLGTDLKILEDRTYFQESETRRFFLHDLTARFQADRHKQAESQ